DARHVTRIWIHLLRVQQTPQQMTLGTTRSERSLRPECVVSPAVCYHFRRSASLRSREKPRANAQLHTLTRQPCCERGPSTPRKCPKSRLVRRPMYHPILNGTRQVSHAS